MRTSGCLARLPQPQGEVDCASPAGTSPRSRAAVVRTYLMRMPPVSLPLRWLPRCGDAREQDEVLCARRPGLSSVLRTLPGPTPAFGPGQGAAAAREADFAFLRARGRTR